MKAWEPTAPRPGRMLTLQEAATLGLRLWGSMR
jgi:hypothetical protein